MVKLVVGGTNQGDSLSSEDDTEVAPCAKELDGWNAVQGEPDGQMTRWIKLEFNGGWQRDHPSR